MVHAVKRHPVLCGIVILLLLVFFLIASLFSSFSNIGTGGLGSLAASTYLADDADINNAELIYTEWETDLQMQINRVESDRPGYDEYRYNIGPIEHDPYVLMGYLTSAYQDFTYAQIESVLRELFNGQYSLSFTEETEIRYRTETSIDPETGEETEEEVPYEWHILNVTLTSMPLENLVVSRMDADQKEICEILLQTKGNRQYVKNVFGTNWLPYVTSYYGYRVHPISGEKNYHTGVDIGMPQGTEILAGHDGTVTLAGNAGGYGLCVAIEGEAYEGHSLTTKYGHCSQILVSAGQEVKAGDVIAKVGSTGNSTGPHLHLEVLVDGQYRNPLYFADTGDTSERHLPAAGAGGGGNYFDYDVPPEALAFSQMFNLLCERADNTYGGRLPYHVRVLWDEAANTGQVPGLEKIVAVIRSREISLTLFYQAMSQCKALYKDHAETIMGNMDSIVFLGGREASTLKDISENWLGKATISMQTDSRTRGQSESYGLNTQRLGRELLTTSEITTMPGNKCLLQLRGLPPFFSPKYDLKQHPNYRYTAEHDSKRNAFHLERLTSRRLRLKPEEEYTVYEVDASDEDADILNYDDLDSADDFV